MLVPLYGALGGEEICLFAGSRYIAYIDTKIQIQVVLPWLKAGYETVQIIYNRVELCFNLKYIFDM